ncbi:MAG: pyrroloquinoline quinone biosynthesis protein PqqB [Tistlia sp.]|uniref:pyrroloquinoline quinone biosynthesis protein PqqB n=1 Tax=Tistlia sp. TaxID=3057121 RepID=UPI0034A2CB89
MLRVLVLGAAAGGGFPQWNSNSPASRRARDGDPVAPACSQSSIAVSRDGRRWVVFNASPDIRQQINDNPPLHPAEGVRHTPIASVVLTNADVDHVAGLLTLRESQAFSLYATPRVLAVLAENSIFNVLNPDFVERRPLALDRPFEPLTRDGEPLGLTVEAFAVPGKVALYKEDAAAGADFGTVSEDTIGLRVAAADGDDGRALFYLPGCAALPDDLKGRLQGAALLLFDGTLWRDDEMQAQGAGVKTGRRMGHLSMAGPDGSIAGLAEVAIARRVFIHINNTNPVLLLDSPERAEVEAAGWEIARDGMEIEL